MKGYKKISDTQGNLDGTLLDLNDKFGISVANLGHFDYKGLSITCTELIGDDPVQNISKINFKSLGSYPSDVCAIGTNLDGSKMVVPSIYLSKGPLGEDNNETVSHCLTLVNVTISQTYSTSNPGGTPWTFTMT